MRTIIHTVAAALTLCFAAAVVSPSVVLAAPKAKSMRAKMAEMKAKDPQSFAACEALARQRGFSTGDLGTSLMMFIDGCIMGKQR